MTAYHGPGDRMDQHNLDSSAHGGAFMAAGSIVPPKLVVPPSSCYSAAPTAWFAANYGVFHRFAVTITGAYRYVNLHVGIASGNIQVGVATATPADPTSMYFTRLAHSGVIACPAAGAQRIDLGATTLTPGDYALFLWCDNTTAAFMHGIGTGFAASRMHFNSSLGASGLGASVFQIGAGTRWISGLTLEAA